MLVFLGDAVELSLVVFLEVLGAGDVDEDVGEHFDGVGISPHHHVAEADVVVGCEVGGHDTGEHGFPVEFDVVEGFKGETEVAEEAVNAEETDNAKVAKHTVEGSGTVVACDQARVGVFFHGGELGGYF